MYYKWTKLSWYNYVWSLYFGKTEDVIRCFVTKLLYQIPAELQCEIYWETGMLECLKIKKKRMSKKFYLFVFSFFFFSQKWSLVSSFFFHHQLQMGKRPKLNVKKTLSKLSEMHPGPLQTPKIESFVK